MFEIDWRAPHLWRRLSAEPFLAHPALSGEREVDLAIVGGGFTGLAPALTAAEAGLDVAVLEAAEIGSAASGRNNGLVIPHHSSATPSEVVSRLGRVHGDRYNTLVAGASARVADRVARHGIACDAVWRGWIQPAHNEATLARGRRFHDEWKALGADVVRLDADEVSRAIGTPYVGGWMARRGGHLNPWALARGLARAVVDAGGAVHEGSAVISVTPAGKRWRVATASGALLASKVLFATNALTGDFWPKLAEAVVPMQVYQAATDPLSDEQLATILPDDPAVSDMRHDLRYFNLSADRRIVTGGTLTVWHDARRRGLAATSRMLAKVFPSLGAAARCTEYWEGVFGVVPDRMPRLMRLAPGVVFAGIYSGRGVALSIAMGEIVGAWLAGRIDDGAMPLPVTDLRRVPFHPVAVQVARRIHPLNRLRDHLA